MITLFVNKFSENGIRTQRLLWDNEIIGYKCKDRQYISLKVGFFKKKDTHFLLNGRNN